MMDDELVNPLTHYRLPSISSSGCYLIPNVIHHWNGNDNDNDNDQARGAHWNEISRVVKGS